jgi:hypothetical protein
MKLQYSFVSILFASLALAEPLSWSNKQEPLYNAADVAIPGNSELKHCNDEFDSDLLEIKNVDLTPYPPVP